MMQPIASDNLINSILGDNLMDATMRLIGVAVAGSLVLGLIFWII